MPAAGRPRSGGSAPRMSSAAPSCVSSPGPPTPNSGANTTSSASAMWPTSRLAFRCATTRRSGRATGRRRSRISRESPGLARCPTSRCPPGPRAGRRSISPYPANCSAPTRRLPSRVSPGSSTPTPTRPSSRVGSSSSAAAPTSWNSVRLEAERSWEATSAASPPPKPPHGCGPSRFPRRRWPPRATGTSRRTTATRG